MHTITPLSKRSLPKTFSPPMGFPYFICLAEDLEFDKITFINSSYYFFNFLIFTDSTEKKLLLAATLEC